MVFAPWIRIGMLAAASLLLQAAAATPAQEIYVSISTSKGNFIAVFPVGATGNVKPVRTIALGGMPADALTNAISIDRDGQLYVLGGSLGDQQLQVYDARGPAVQAPRQVLHGANTQLSAGGMAYLMRVGNRNVYVAHNTMSGGDMLVWSRGASGNVAPADVLKVRDPVGKPTGDMGVAVGDTRIYTFEPVTTLTGIVEGIPKPGSGVSPCWSPLLSGFADLEARAVDAFGLLWLSNDTHMVGYRACPATGSGPIVIGGKNGTFDSIRDAAVDSSGNLYVLDSAHGVLVFHTGNQSETAVANQVISGSNTSLSEGPTAIAVGP